MLTTTLLVRWVISIVVMVALLLGFYVLLRFLKEKNINFKFIQKQDDKTKMQICDQLYLDSKNKILKVKDNDKMMTLLIGDNVKLIKEEKYKEK